MAGPSVTDLYRESRPRLFAIAYRMLGSAAEAEDVVQAVFTTAYPRWDAIDEPRAYLRRAVVNASNRKMRRETVNIRGPRRAARGDWESFIFVSSLLW